MKLHSLIKKGEVSVLITRNVLTFGVSYSGLSFSFIHIHKLQYFRKNRLQTVRTIEGKRDKTFMQSFN